MLIHFQTNEWNAEVICTDPPNIGKHGYHHVEVTSFGASDAACLAGVEFVRDVLAKGRTTRFRVKPSADHWKDFDSKTVLHRGYARFSFTLEPGEWHDPESRPEGTFVGFAHG
jgi:hypothetical protein